MNFKLKFFQFAYKTLLNIKIKFQLQFVRKLFSKKLFNDKDETKTNKKLKNLEWKELKQWRKYI